jgi:hypothetical protein
VPNDKHITATWGETGETLYAIIRRELDSYRLNDADGAFASAPADPFLSLTEDSVIKGLYEATEARAAWDDGYYTIMVYKQAGVTPVPLADTPVGTGRMYIEDDTETDAISKLVIPDYTGPVVSIPAPPTPAHQTLYGSNKEFGAATWSQGDTITMTLLGRDQASSGGSLMEPITRTTTVASDGSWNLTPDIGVEIKVTASNASGVYFTKKLTVDTNASKDIADYTE